MYDTAKCIGFTKIVTTLPQSMDFLIAIMTSDSNILAQVLYQNQSTVQLIGDVICPSKKCRGEKCVNIRSFKEINKGTYQCKQSRACSHVLNIPFKDQKHVLAYLVGPTALEKRQSRITRKRNSRF